MSTDTPVTDTPAAVLKRTSSSSEEDGALEPEVKRPRLDATTATAEDQLNVNVNVNVEQQPSSSHVSKEAEEEKNSSSKDHRRRHSSSGSSRDKSRDKGRDKDSKHHSESSRHRSSKDNDRHSTTNDKHRSSHKDDHEPKEDNKEDRERREKEDRDRKERREKEDKERRDKEKEREERERRDRDKEREVRHKERDEREKRDREDRERKDRDRNRDRGKPQREDTRKDSSSSLKGSVKSKAEDDDDDEEYRKRVEAQLQKQEEEERRLEESRRKREEILRKHKQPQASMSPQPQASPVVSSIATATTVAVPSPMLSSTSSQAETASASAAVPDAAAPVVLAADYNDMDDKIEERQRNHAHVAEQVKWATVSDDEDEDGEDQKKRPVGEEEVDVEDDSDATVTDIFSEPDKAAGHRSRTDSSATASPSNIATPAAPTKPAPKPSNLRNEVDVSAAAVTDDMFAPVGHELDMFAKFDANKKLVQIKPILSTNTTVDANPTLTDNWDDEDGYYRLRVGELLDNRYRITSNMGKGVFSTVVRANDLKETGREVAIKIIRNNEVMYKSGLKEATILRKLNDSDPLDRKHIIRLLRQFEHRSHLCLVFESLTMNLREVVSKYGKEVGLNIKAVRLYAHHLFLALSHLRKCGVLHADIKPDNILVNESKSVLKLCDLGSASFVTENEITPYLVSRFYRPPEVVLGLPYDYAMDMWSVGCTLYELYTGKILFPGKRNNDMLRMFQEVKGKFSNKLIRKGAFSSQHFDENYNFRSMEFDKLRQKEVMRTVQFTQASRDFKMMLLGSRSGSDEDMRFLKHFVDLLENIFTLNPEKRITPEEALRHPFIKDDRAATAAAATKAK